MDIAVVVNGGVTETLQATPLLRTLRAGLPRSRITLFCPSTARELAEGIPPVDRVVLQDGLRGRGSGGGRLWLALRRMRLDAAVLCAGTAGSGAAAYLAGVPLRVGGPGIPAVVLTRRIVAAHDENRARTWLRLAGLLDIHQELNGPVFEPGPESRRRGDQMVHGSGLADGRLLVALAPGTGFAEADTTPAEFTAWDPERWAHLANQLAQRHGAGILILGSPHDRGTIERTKVDLRAAATDLVGDTDLGALAGVLARCDLLVGGDTPLLHLAAAMGTPSVGLFGPTNGTLRGAYGRDHRVIQALDTGARNGSVPATGSLMDQIRVEDVLAAIESSL